jgi:hypothetical protein
MRLVKEFSFIALLCFLFFSKDVLANEKTIVCANPITVERIVVETRDSWGKVELEKVELFSFERIKM